MDPWVEVVMYNTSRAGVPYQIRTKLKWRGRVSGVLWARR